MKDVSDKNKDVVRKIVSFVKKDKRYFMAGVLFLCFVLVLVFFTGTKFNSNRVGKSNSVEVSGEDYTPDAEFEIDAYTELNQLIQAYFDAYVCADSDALQKIAVPISDTELNYITTMSQFYEAYQNVKCYTKHGLSKDSFIVAACFDVKFSGIEQTAPSMMLFYVQTNESGELYINNLYSDFNLQYSENSVSKDVYTALRKFTTQDDYLELCSEVETEFSSLLKENADIYQLTKRTIPGTRQLWEDTVYYVQDTEMTDDAESTEDSNEPSADEPKDDTTDESEDGTTDEESTNEPEDGTTDEESTNEPEDGTTDEESTNEPEEDTTDEESTNESEDDSTVRVRTENGIRVREGAGTSYDVIGEAHDGDEFVKLGVKDDENGEEWTKIQYTDSAVGYIKSSFLY